MYNENYSQENTDEFGVQTVFALASRRPRAYISGVQRLGILNFGIQASEGTPILPIKKTTQAIAGPLINLFALHDFLWAPVSLILWVAGA